jgi:MobA/MobL family
LVVFFEKKNGKMSKGFINISTSKSGDISYYLHDGECIDFYHKDAAFTKAEIVSAWKTIGNNEIIGNKTLGIRGRHDAQVRKNYTLTMPNSLSSGECIERVKHLIEQTPIKDCTYTIAVHKGEKDGIVNRHVHLLVNERNVHTMKKDREMINKFFLEKSFRPLYEKTFEEEFSKGRAVEKRERIQVGLYSADPAKARRGIVVYQRTSNFYRRQEQERKAFEERRNQEQIQRRERLENVAQQIQVWEKSKEVAPNQYPDSSV